MSTKMKQFPFYRPDAICNLNWYKENETEYLLNLGVKQATIREHIDFRFDKFFETRIEFDSRVLLPDTLCLPRRDSNFINLPIPYDVGDHNEILIENMFVSKIVENHVAAYFSKPLFLFSGNPYNRICLTMENFSYKMLYILMDGRMNGNFLLFDSKMDQCFNFHFDLCITIFTRLKSAKDKKLFSKEDEFWYSYFNKNFEGYNSHHRTVIKLDYGSKIPEIKLELR